MIVLEKNGDCIGRAPAVLVTLLLWAVGCCFMGGGGCCGGRGRAICCNLGG